MNRVIKMTNEDLKNIINSKESSLKIEKDVLNDINEHVKEMKAWCSSDSKIRRELIRKFKISING